MSSILVKILERRGEDNDYNRDDSDNNDSIQEDINDNNHSSP